MMYKPQKKRPDTAKAIRLLTNTARTSGVAISVKPDLPSKVEIEDLYKYNKVSPFMGK